MRFLNLFLGGCSNCVFPMAQVANLSNEEIPQIYTLCGRGPRSSLRILRPGLAVTEAAVSPLPANPTAVWTVKKAVGNDFDAYIVVSFQNATLVLSIGETVEEVNDSGFSATAPTLAAQLLADNSMLQVGGFGKLNFEGLAGRSSDGWGAAGFSGVLAVFGSFFSLCWVCVGGGGGCFLTTRCSKLPCSVSVKLLWNSQKVSQHLQCCGPS